MKTLGQVAYEAAREIEPDSFPFPWAEASGKWVANWEHIAQSVAAAAVVPEGFRVVPQALYDEIARYLLNGRTERMHELLAAPSPKFVAREPVARTDAAIKELVGDEKEDTYDG